jgi:hypothetical protein
VAERADALRLTGEDDQRRQHQRKAGRRRQRLR